MKKFVSLFLAGVMTFSMSSVVFADESKEVSNEVVEVVELVEEKPLEEVQEITEKIEPTEEAVEKTTNIAVEKKEHNVVINGKKSSFSTQNEYYLNKSPLLTADEIATNFKIFGDAKAIATKNNAYVYSDVSYYNIKNVADKNGYRYFYDETTNTSLVISKTDYKKIVEALESINNVDFKTCDMSFDANIAIALELSEMQSLLQPEEGFEPGISADSSLEIMPEVTTDEAIGVIGGAEEELSDTLSEKLDMSMSADMKMDIENGKMMADMTMSLLGQTQNTISYDDGKFLYTRVTEDPEVWVKQESQMQEMNMKELLEFSKTYAISEEATALSYAGLTYKETDKLITIEGDMYVGKLYEEMDFMKLLTEIAGVADMPEEVLEVYENMDIRFPETMKVKYVLDKKGNIKEMKMDFGMGITVEFMGVNASVDVEMDMTVDKFIMNEPVEITVPQSVVDKAVTMDAYFESVISTMDVQ